MQSNGKAHFGSWSMVHGPRSHYRLSHHLTRYGPLQEEGEAAGPRRDGSEELAPATISAISTVPRQLPGSLWEKLAHSFPSDLKQLVGPVRISFFSNILIYFFLSSVNITYSGKR